MRFVTWMSKFFKCANSDHRFLQEHKVAYFEEMFTVLMLIMWINFKVSLLSICSGVFQHVC